MEDREFIKWLYGFTNGVHHYNISPKQWDFLKEEVKKVVEQKETGYIINQPNWVTTLS